MIYNMIVIDCTCNEGMMKSVDMITPVVYLAGDEFVLDIVDREVVSF